MMENPIKIDDLGAGGTPIFGNTHIYIYIALQHFKSTDEGKTQETMRDKQQVNMLQKNNHLANFPQIHLCTWIINLEIFLNAFPSMSYIYN